MYIIKIFSLLSFIGGKVIKDIYGFFSYEFWIIFWIFKNINLFKKN